MTDFTKPDFSHCGDENRRHDFVILFDVVNGNPNGDPDADNLPRQDQETNQGLVTDVCLKRKVRNFVGLTQDDAAPNRIYIQDKGIYLNDLNAESHKAVGIPAAKAKDPDRGDRDKARAWMCANFYDVRMFGAVMSTGVNAGQVRGPMQLTFSRSVDPILPMEVAVTRVALTNEKEKAAAGKQTSPVADSEAAGEGAVEAEQRFGRTGTIGRKSIVPYGLYVGYGFFSPMFAAQTGVTRPDLELFWKALMSMWDLDHSAARGLMSCRGLHVFSHADRLGNAPAHKLFECVDVKPVGTPRAFSDYTVTVNENALPGGITLTSLVTG